MRLQGARAVVMGGASGLRLAVAERLVELGARGGARSPSPVALPPGAAYVEADVGSEAAADRPIAGAWWQGTAHGAGGLRARRDG